MLIDEMKHIEESRNQGNTLMDTLNMNLNNLVDTFEYVNERTQTEIDAQSLKGSARSSAKNSR